MSIPDEHLVNRLLYAQFGGRRFTQDTPIMPDVWLAFAAEPRKLQDLILTPTRETRAGRVAKKLRELLSRYREAPPDIELALVEDAVDRPSLPRIAHLPGRVSAELYFDELMRIVLALTPWWKRSPQSLREAPEPDWQGFPDLEDSIRPAKLTDALVGALERARTGERASRSAAEGDAGSAAPTPDLVWIVRLAGAVVLSCEDPEKDFNDKELSHPIRKGDFVERLRQYLGLPVKGERDVQAENRSFDRLLAHGFLQLYRGWPVEEPPKDRLLWRVSLNRRAETAIQKSALAIKADAARLLFEISCQSITWAVVDSGIDRGHPAFRNHEQAKKETAETPGDGAAEAADAERECASYLENPSRVDRTLDFRDFKELLDLYVLEPFLDQPEADSPSLLDELKSRIAGWARSCGEGFERLLEDFDENLLRRRLARVERAARGLRETPVPGAKAILEQLEQRRRPQPPEEPEELADLRAIVELHAVIKAATTLAEEARKEAARRRTAEATDAEAVARLETHAATLGRELEGEEKKAGLESLAEDLQRLIAKAKAALEGLEEAAQRLQESISLDSKSGRLLAKLRARREMDPCYKPDYLRKLRDVIELREIFDDLSELARKVEQGYEHDWSLLERLIIDRVPEEPPNEHGTHVAGILGADWREVDAAGEQRIKMQGVCPDIRLVDLRVLRDDGKSDEFEVIGAIQYLRYRNSTAGHMEIQGANLSLSIPHEVADFACGRTPICEECEEAVALGMVIVAAAGNRGYVRYRTADEGTMPGYSTVSITDPGNAEAVITVGSTHRSRAYEYGVSYFSSRGPTGDGRIKPDLIAPGEKIKAPIPAHSYAFKDGTSMAAPHVSGAAAMLMARHKELIGKPARIKRILCATASDLGRERYFQGAGMVDILRALQSI